MFNYRLMALSTFRRNTRRKIIKGKDISFLACLVLRLRSSDNPNNVPIARPPVWSVGFEAMHMKSEKKVQMLCGN